MARLFVTPRDLNYISDIAKEIIKDVNGQFVYLHPISEIKTKTHGLYNESPQKIFDQPIKLDAFVDSIFQSDTKIDKFGVDNQYKIEVFVQYRDLVDKGININIGDFFSYSDIFYEITEQVVLRNIYGQAEHKNGIKLVGVKAREGLFKAETLGPTDIARPEADAVQTIFVQQRGYDTDENGDPTGDKRDLIENGTLEPPLTGKREVSEKGDDHEGGSSFYDE